MFDAWRVRLRALARSRVTDAELDEELRYHLVAETERNVAKGMTPREAALAARRAFGNPTVLREEARDAAGWQWLEQLGQDARYACRAFLRAPVFSVTVIGTIALALGLNATAFTIFDAYVLRPAAVRDPGSLVQLTWSDRAGRSRGFSWRDYQALRSDQDVLTETFAYRVAYVRMDSMPTFGQLVTGNYFALLGVGSSLGRTLVPSDAAEPGANAVVVLSYATWMSRFAGDSAIIGKTVRLRGRPFQVVGVAARGFTGLESVPFDFWTPITMQDLLLDGLSPFLSPDAELLKVVGRLRSDVPRTQGEAWLLAWIRGRRPDSPPREAPLAAGIRTHATAILLSPSVLLLFAPIATAFGLVLLIACANVANMMLARGMARQRELGIRLSLGASRHRLVRQLVTEAALLACAAALIGFAIARLTLDEGVRLMYRTLAAELVPYIRIVPLTLDGRIFLFMLAAAAASVVMFGLLPALQATRTNIVQATRGEFASDARPSALRNALVVGQVTVCVLLLTCAGILLSGVSDLALPDFGLTTRGILWLDVRDHGDARTRVLDALRARADVRGLAAATSAPFAGRFQTASVTTNDRHAATVFYNFITGSYFDLLGLRFVQGRNFTADEERSGAAVAIVSEATARALWPGHEPIGQTVQVTADSNAAGSRRFSSRTRALVVGVVPNAALGTVIDPLDAPVLYYPMALNAPGALLLARVTGVADVVIRTIDRDLTRIAPESVLDTHTLEAFRIGSIYPFRAAYWVAAALGAIALILTLTGVYGVLSYVVAQRRKELGIRVALGATSVGLAALVFRQSLRLCLGGLALGTALALGVARVFAANIVRMETYQPAAFLGAGLLVLLSCLAATYLPSRRAARTDPMDALRES